MGQPIPQLLRACSIAAPNGRGIGFAPGNSILFLKKGVSRAHSTKYYFVLSRIMAAIFLSTFVERRPSPCTPTTTAS
jgi:hypothetical protein